MEIIYLFLGIIILLFELTRKKRYKIFDLLSAVNYMFAIYYCFVPFGLTTLDITQFYEDWALPAIIRQFYYSDLDYMSPFYNILLAYIVTIFVFYYTEKVRFVFRKRKQINYMEYEVPYLTLSYIGVIFVVLGILGILVYALSVGGIVDAVLKAEYYRSGDLSNDSSFLIVRIFQPFIISGYFIFESMIIDENYHDQSKTTKVTINIFRFISFLFIIYYLLIASSRSKIVIFVACMFMIRKKKIKIKELLIVGILVVFFFVFGDSLLSGRAIEIQGLLRIYAKLLEQTAFPFVNLCKLEDINQVIDNYRFFSDLLYVWIINLVPTSILGIFGLKKINNLFRYNTFLMNSSSNIPVDYISFGYWQLGNIGIIINSIIFGIFLTRLERILSGNQKIIYILYIRIFFAILGAITNFETENIIRGNLDIIVLIILYLYNARYKNMHNKRGNYG